MHDNIAPPDGSGAGCEEPPQAPEMDNLVSAFDWSSTPLGPSAAWPDSLKAVVRIVLTSGFPMWMAWGQELTMLYNDAYARTTLGKKHPWALGRPAYEVWHEIWKDIGPLIDRVMESGEACWEEVLQLILERNGYPEETYHTFSYSPLAGPDGNIAGMLCVVIEDTVRVIGERQLSALSTLAAELAGTISEQDVFSAIERGVAGQKDMPCTLTYLFDEDATQPGRKDRIRTRPSSRMPHHQRRLQGSPLADSFAAGGKPRHYRGGSGRIFPRSASRLLGSAADPCTVGPHQPPGSGKAGGGLHCRTESISPNRRNL